MALQIVQASHVRVTCDSCRSATAELCARRELPVVARASCVARFKAAGWHHDPGDHARLRTLEEAERGGSGRWYCPACARRTHL
jgi:hypothetical protein